MICDFYLSCLTLCHYSICSSNIAKINYGLQVYISLTIKTENYRNLFMLLFPQSLSTQGWTKYSPWTRSSPPADCIQAKAGHAMLPSMAPDGPSQHTQLPGGAAPSEAAAVRLLLDFLHFQQLLLHLSVLSHSGQQVAWRSNGGHEDAWWAPHAQPDSREAAA